MGISDEVRDAIRADQQQRAEFEARVAGGVAAGLCEQCARGYHINHLTPGPILLHGKPHNSGGECTECPCEWPG